MQRSNKIFLIIWILPNATLFLAEEFSNGSSLKSAQGKRYPRRNFCQIYVPSSRSPVQLNWLLCCLPCLYFVVVFQMSWQPGGMRIAVVVVGVTIAVIILVLLTFLVPIVYSGKISLLAKNCPPLLLLPPPLYILDLRKNWTMLKFFIEGSWTASADWTKWHNPLQMV